MTKVWDLALRIWHWCLVSAIIAAFVTAELAEESFDAAIWHMYIGVLVLALLAFRICWGVWGTRYAKWSSLRLSPRHLKSEAKHPPLGHSTTGSWATLLILAVILTQAFTGLFSFDTGLYIGGPFSNSVSESLQTLATSIHHLGENTVIGVIVLHLVALTFYQLTGKPIMRSMIHGKKTSVTPNDHPHEAVSLTKLLVSIALSATLFIWLALTLS